MAAEPSQDKRCKDLSTPCTTVPLSSVISLLFHFTFHIAHVQQSYLSLHVHKTLNVLLKLPSVRI